MPSRVPPVFGAAQNAGHWMNDDYFVHVGSHDVLCLCARHQDEFFDGHTRAAVHAHHLAMEDYLNFIEGSQSSAGGNVECERFRNRKKASPRTTLGARTHADTTETLSQRGWFAAVAQDQFQADRSRIAILVHQ